VNDQPGLDTRILIVNSSIHPRNLGNAESIRNKLHVPSDIKHFQRIRTLEGYGGVIISGQPIDDPSYDPDKVKQDYSWIRKIQVPLLGICGGHQAIGLIFSARLIHESEGGVIDAYVDVPSDPIFHNLDTKLNSFMAGSYHRDSITLPEGFVQLAHTIHCPNSIMRHQTRKIYGTQFHPENPYNISGLRQAEQLLTNFEALILNALQWHRRVGLEPVN